MVKEIVEIGNNDGMVILITKMKYNRRKLHCEVMISWVFKKRHSKDPMMKIIHFAKHNPIKTKMIWMQHVVGDKFKTTRILFR